MCKSCIDAPTFGYPDTMKATKCKRHKQEGMIKIYDVAGQIEKLISQQIKVVANKHKEEYKAKVEELMSERGM